MGNVADDADVRWDSTGLSVLLWLLLRTLPLIDVDSCSSKLNVLIPLP